MPGKKNIRLLVVEDDVLFRSSLCKLLARRGYEVTGVADGQKAVKQVLQDDIDLVLMDIHMPVMNGIEAFKAIKQAKPLMPVVMITAYPSSDLTKEARGLGIPCLDKPIKMDNLESIITNAIRQHP